MDDGSEELLAKAKEAISSCYCPYSGFHVTAVIEDDEGGLHWGVNVENSSYGLTICAERAAVFNAISRGQKKFRRILIYSPDSYPLPCGACRQVLAEFCDDDFPVILATPDSIKHYTLGELLPHRF
ncbi:cytidine deaminase [Candidatus Fermentibacteria bacterium]|nr:MAG: cytidine deaminase [Candidatus Fermentibacteria bacterium]